MNKFAKKFKNFFIIPQRYVLGIMCFLAVVNAYQMRQCLNIAINEMVYEGNNTSGNHEDQCPDLNQPKDTSMLFSSNHRDADVGDGKFDWSSERQGLILSSFYWGYVLTHIPGGVIADLFGGKWTLGIGILVTAIGTLLIPVAAQAGSGWLMACRILTGLGEGTTFPALSTMLARWMPLSERSLMGSLVFAGAQIGTITGNIISGAFLSSYEGHWSIVFYFFGVIGIIWFLFFILLCYSEPSQHPFIKNKEKEYLQRVLGSLGKDEDTPPPPWRYIVTSLPLWGLVAAQLGHDWAFFTINTDLPKYMKDILRYNIKDNSLLSSIPYVAMWLVAALSGRLVDYIIKRQWLSITKARKIFTTIAHIGPSIFLIAASYAGCNRTEAVVMFTLCLGFMGTFYPGMKVNIFDLSPNYAGTLMAIVNGFGAISGIVTPYIVGALTPNHYKKEWRNVFWITVGVNIVTNIIFVALGSGKVQWWNDIKKHRDNENKLQSEEITEQTKSESKVKELLN